jgi:hypothetical protein
VVEVDVQDGDPFGTASPYRLGHDRGVVVEAVAADEVAPGVMSRRTAQPIGERRAVEDEIESGEADVNRRRGGGRGALDDRGRGVEAVRAQPVVAATGHRLEPHPPRVFTEQERIG